MCKTNKTKFLAGWIKGNINMNIINNKRHDSYSKLGKGIGI